MWSPADVTYNVTPNDIAVQSNGQIVVMANSQFHDDSALQTSRSYA